MNAPVYIITGFLDSGKTTFIQEMITDEGFSEGERTLLLCCEEGEVEYDEKMLKDNNTILYTFEDMDELAGEKLIELDKEYRPERVIIEYNATWLMETL